MNFDELPQLIVEQREFIPFSPLEVTPKFEIVNPLVTRVIKDAALVGIVIVIASQSPDGIGRVGCIGIPPASVPTIAAPEDLFGGSIPEDMSISDTNDLLSGLGDIVELSLIHI